eukprot:scaffold67444_cov24-Cyclotella_meneghiniana.AAC.1
MIAEDGEEMNLHENFVIEGEVEDYLIFWMLWKRPSIGRLTLLATSAITTLHYRHADLLDRRDEAGIGIIQMDRKAPSRSASDPTAHDATEYNMDDVIRCIHGFGNVEVTRSEADGQGGDIYLVTLIEDCGPWGYSPSPCFQFSDRQRSNGISYRNYKSYYGAEYTADLPFDAPADAIKTALEGLSMIGYWTLIQWAQ